MRWRNSLLFLFLNRFFYALMIPVALTLALSLNWVNVRREVLADHLREHQREQIRRIEVFYEQKFVPDLKYIFLQSIQKLDIPADITAEHWFKLYGTDFLQGLGFPAVSDEKSEKNSPIRLLYCQMEYQTGGAKPKNLYDLLSKDILFNARKENLRGLSTTLLRPIQSDQDFKEWIEALKESSKRPSFQSKKFIRINRDEKYYLRDEIIDEKDLNSEDDWFLLGGLFDRLNRWLILGGPFSPININLVDENVAFSQLMSNTSETFAFMKHVSRYFSYLPHGNNFTLESYNKNQLPPPTGVLYAALNPEKLDSFFIQILNFFLKARQNKWGSKETIERYFLSLGITPELVNSEVRHLMKEFFELMNTTGSNELLSFSEAALRYILGQSSQWTRYRNHLWLNSSELQVFDSNPHLDLLGRLNLNPNELKQFLDKRTSRFAFNFDRGGIQYESTLFRTRVFAQNLFSLSLDSRTAYQELILIQARTWLALLFTLVLILLSINILRRRVPEALSIVNQEVQDFRQRLTSQRWKASSSDFPINCASEIAELRKSFQSMSLRINERLFEISSINEINQELVKGTPIDELLTLGIEKISTIMYSQLCMIVVFEDFSEERIIHTEVYDRYDRPNSEIKEILSMITRQAANIKQPQKIGISSSTRIQLVNPYLIPLGREPVEDTRDSMLPELKAVLLLEPYDPDQASQIQSQFLEDFTTQLRTVLSKAHLEKVREDNVTGNQVQLQLMPSVAPNLHGTDICFHYAPVNFLGGDFLDFLEYDDSKSLGLLVSDVSGKGIGPALLGASVKAYLQAHKQDMDPGKILEAANKLICPRTSPGLFATLFLGIFDSTEQTLQYAAAGHNMMIHYNSDSGQIEHLDTEDFPLGLSDDFTFETKSTDFKSGDLLVLYTDGLVDVNSPEGSPYGTTALENLIINSAHGTAREITELVLEAIQTHSRGIPYPDDISIIVFKNSAVLPS